MINRTSVKRRGASGTQMAVALAVITVIILASVQFVGNETNDDLTRTAGEVGNPSTLVSRFGNYGGSGSTEPSQGDSGGGDDSGNDGGDSGGGGDTGGGGSSGGGGGVCP